MVKKKAEQSYLLCIEAIDKIHQITKSLKMDVGFSFKKGFYYASGSKDVQEIKSEYALRKEIGIALELLTREDIKQLFPFAAPVGLLSEAGAQIDAYCFTHELLEESIKNGLDVFDSTEVTDINYNKTGVALKTSYGEIIKARKLIIACGYESQAYVPKKVVNFNSSFAIVSEPIDMKRDFWHENCLIWETARPYLYIRSTDDGRILIGGKDEPFYNPGKRDRMTINKGRLLRNAFIKKFPDIDFRTDFCWAGTFAETKDGLPYIGKISGQPHTYYALGFGGNGIVFSLIAAEMIRDNLTGKKHEADNIFKFTR